MRIVIFLLFLTGTKAEADAPAYWDYGVGVGAVHYEQYPSSNQFSNLALPAPTFQYRGKILRADDRDGAHVYLFKGSTFSLELGGEGYPALDSSNNRAREGMKDLPWLLALGPKLVARPVKDFELSLGLYQAITTDFRDTRTAGAVFEGRASYRWLFKEGERSVGKLSFSLKGGSQEFQSIYFSVPTSEVTLDRAAYKARDGFLSHNLSYFQSYKTGRVSVYAGAIINSYELSANRQSPLHLSDHNVMAAVGLNYVLGESERPAVPEDETSGLINLRRNRQLRNFL